MDIWKLFIIALMPNLKVLLITVLGTFLAINRFHILTETARNNMNTMVYFVFSPALACSSLAKTITLRSVITMWFMPLSIFLTVIIGTALGWLLVKMARVPYHLRGLVLGCCAVGNLGNLPLIIVPAICKERSNPFGDMDVCYKNAMAYASLSLAIASILVWSYAFNIVRIYSTQDVSNVVKDDHQFTVNPTSTIQTDPQNLSKGSTRKLHTVEDRSNTNSCVNQLEVETIVQHGQDKVYNVICALVLGVLFENLKRKQKIMKYLKILAKGSNLNVFCPPTLIGAIIGLLIGAVPQFRNLLVGGNAPLHVLQDSMIMIGDACIPAMTMLVGANLLEGCGGQGVQFPLIVGIIVIRNIALPAIGVGIVKGALHFGLIHHDPLYEFVLLLQFALPPAVAISTSTQLFGNGKGECSVIMLACYSCAAISLTLWFTFFIWLVL